MPDPLTSFPRTLIAGNRLTVVVARDERAADGWSMLYRAVQVLGADAFEVAGTDDGARWTFDAPPADTARTAGTYTWTVIASKGSPVTDRATPFMGRLELRPDPATATGAQMATQDERDLAAVIQVRQGIVDGEMANYMVGGQQIQLLSLADLMKLEDRLRARVAARRNGGRLRALAMVVP